MRFLPPLPHRLVCAVLRVTCPAIAVSLAASAAEPTAPTAVVTPAPVGSQLTIDDAIALALRRNQRIKVSEFGRGIGRANVLAQYGRFEPAFAFRRNHSENDAAVSTTPLLWQVSKSDDYSLALEGTTPWGLTYQIGGNSELQRGTFNQFTNQYVTTGGVSITQPLLRGFGFGANLADLRIAKADRAISDWQYRQTVIDIVTNVILAYNDVAEARESLRIAERSRNLAAQLVTDNERRNHVGSISDADVTQARAQVATRDESILFAQRGLKDAENRLRELIGETLFAASGSDLPIEPLRPVPPLTPDGPTDFQRALELRPDFQAAKLGVTKRRAGDAFARNQMLPRVDFVGSYGYNGISTDFATSRAQVRNEDHRAYTAGVVVSVPLTLMEGRGRARAAKLAVRQSEADLERMQQDIAVNVAAAIGQLETTAKRVEATTRAYQLAQQALDNEQKRLRAGSSNTFFVLQLQEQLASAQSRQVRAIADEQRAVAVYQREIGTTLLAHSLKLD